MINLTRITRIMPMCARCKPHIYVLPCMHYPNRAIVKSSLSILSEVRRTPDAGGPMRSGVSAALGTDLPVRRVPASAGDRPSGRAHGDPMAQRMAMHGRGTLTGAAMWRPWLPGLRGAAAAGGRQAVFV